MKNLHKDVSDIGPDVMTYIAMAQEERRKPRGQSIANRVVQKYTPLVKRTAESFSRRKVLPMHLRSLDDLIQAGYEGLLYALNVRFHHDGPGSPGRRFTACCSFWIRREIQMTIERDPTVSRSRQGGMPAKVVRMNDRIRAATGREATAEELGITDNKLKSWNNMPQCVGIDGGMRIHSRHVPHPVRVTLRTTLSDLCRAAEDIENADAARELNRILATLSDDDVTIVLLAIEDKSWTNIGKTLDISPAEVEERYEAVLDLLYYELT